MTLLKLILIITVISIINICNSRNFKKNKEFDYIVIGGGASGTIASVELAKKFPLSSVLLLERGIDDTEVPDTHKLSGWPEILVTQEAHESIRYENGVWTIIGNILAGGSALNAGIMGEETDEFFRNTFKFNENQVQGIKDMYQKLYDELGHKVPQTGIADDFTTASSEMQLENTGYQHGYIKKNSTFLTYSAFDVEKGTRNTTADYIRNAKSKGEVPNLTVQVRSLVTRLIIDNENKISAISVLHNGIQEIYNVACSVLLAAGTIKSTQLLQVSGIGPFTQLKEAGIPTVFDFPEVGSEFIDRIVESVVQFAPLEKKIPLEPIPSLSVEDNLLEERTSGGRISSSFAVAMGAMLNPEDRTKINMIAFKNLLNDFPNTKDCIDNAIQINVLVANPTSRGYIKPLTPNIVDWPSIDPKFLDTEEDKKNSEKAVNKCFEYYEHESLSKWARTSDPTLECGLAFKFPIKMQSKRTSSLHIFGGLSFGKVLDQNFMVKNFYNLYAIDGSVFPRATEINPFNTISAMGGFIAREFVKPPQKKPLVNKRVKIRSVKDNNLCLSMVSMEGILRPIKCQDENVGSFLWIQNLNTGRYTDTPKSDTPYLLRSKLDDRYCMNYELGLVNNSLCNTKKINQHVYFVPLNSNENSFLIKFKINNYSVSCLSLWYGRISGSICYFYFFKSYQWKIEIQDLD